MSNRRKDQVSLNSLGFDKTSSHKTTPSASTTTSANHILFNPPGRMANVSTGTGNSGMNRNAVDGEPNNSTSGKYVPFTATSSFDLTNTSLYSLDV